MKKKENKKYNTYQNLDFVQEGVLQIHENEENFQILCELALNLQGQTQGDSEYTGNNNNNNFSENASEANNNSQISVLEEEVKQQS